MTHANYLRNLLKSDGATGSGPLRANLDSHWCIVHLAFEMWDPWCMFQIWKPKMLRKLLKVIMAQPEKQVWILNMEKVKSLPVKYVTAINTQWRLKNKIARCLLFCFQMLRVTVKFLFSAMCSKCQKFKGCFHLRSSPIEYTYIYINCTSSYYNLWLRFKISNHVIKKLQ